MTPCNPTKREKSIQHFGHLHSRNSEVLAFQFCGYSCLLYWGGKGKEFQYIFTGLEFIIRTHDARALYFSLESSSKCKVSLLVSRYTDMCAQLRELS